MLDTLQHISYYRLFRFEMQPKYKILFTKITWPILDFGS